MIRSITIETGISFMVQVCLLDLQETLARHKFLQYKSTGLISDAIQFEHIRYFACPYCIHFLDGSNQNSRENIGAKTQITP